MHLFAIEILQFYLLNLYRYCRDPKGVLLLSIHEHIERLSVGKDGKKNVKNKANVYLGRRMLIIRIFKTKRYALMYSYR